jgi:hypothetical protein
VRARRRRLPPIRRARPTLGAGETPLFSSTIPLVDFDHRKLRRSGRGGMQVTQSSCLTQAKTGRDRPGKGVVAQSWLN